MSPCQKKITISTSSTTEAHSGTSARSEIYARRQVPIPNPIMTDETNIHDNTTRRPGIDRHSAQTLVYQGEI